MSTQKAPLEKFLNKLRTKKIIDYVRSKKVLDFGCGQNAWTAQFLEKYCKEIVGIDQSIDKNVAIIGNIPVHNSLSAIQKKKFDVITMLAVIEHIKPIEFRELLSEFRNYTTEQSIIVATIPTVKARPILEFLSYKLRLIDRSQITDHKAYYDDLWINEMLYQTSWRVEKYQTFQFGLNSLVVLSRAEE